MLNPEQLALLQKYADQELSEEEQLQFEHNLANNTEFAEEVALYRDINEFLQHPITQARLKVDILLEELLEKSVAANSTHAERLLLFAPIAELEEAIHTRAAMAASGQDSLQTLIVLPANAIDVINYLPFELKKPVTSPLLCRIFSNQNEQLSEQKIEEQEVWFDVALSLQPGRYYWELVPTDRSIKRQLGTASGWFFVGKALMPDA